MKLSSILEFLPELLDNVVGTILSIIIIALLMRMFVGLKRWYGRARIRRSSADFKKTGEYISGTGKKINRFQRLILGLTGEVYTNTGIIVVAVIFALAAALGLFLGENGANFFSLIFTPTAMHVLYVILIAVLELLYLCLWIDGLKSLVKYARVIPFAVYSLGLVIFSVTLIENLFGIRIY